MRRLEALAFGIVLATVIIAGIINAQWYGGGWWVQVSVNGPSNVEVKLTDIYGHTATVPGGWAGALGPIYGWWDRVYASIVSGPSGCSV